MIKSRNKSRFEPTPADAFKFETYKNYVCSLGLFIGHHYGGAEQRLERLKSHLYPEGVRHSVQKPSGSISAIEEIKKLLFNAWNTEIVLTLPRSISVDFVKYANHWSPVQSYYSIYLALQAYFRSRGSVPPKNHTTALNMIGSQLLSENLFPPFWSVCCAGGLEIETSKYTNLPAGVSVQSASSLATPTHQGLWDSYGMLLRTTRKRQYENVKEGAKHFKTKGGKRDYPLDTR